MLILSLLSPVWCAGQPVLEGTSVNGNFYTKSMYYLKDSVMDSSEYTGDFRSNSYGNIFFRVKDFSAGIRYEAYLPPILGYDIMYEGQGIAFRYASWEDPLFSVTIGNFYEQFGSGLILRAYEDKELGVDNSLDGIRLLFKPRKDVVVKGFVGKQRFYWSKGPGIIKGADVEWNIAGLSGRDRQTTVIAGAGIVSRYQPDKDPLYKLPENVFDFGSRLSLLSGPLLVSGEYARKINDPSAVNNMIYKNGQALVISSSYSKKGFGILVSGKWVDNMDFRSDRSAVGNSLTLSYIPVSFAPRTYSLPAMYPYPSRPLGEAAIQFQMNGTLRGGTLSGGKYGTHFTVSAAFANGIRKSPPDQNTSVDTPGTRGYSSTLLSIGKEKYYRDCSLEISGDPVPGFRVISGISRVLYNKSVIEGHPGEKTVKSWMVWDDFSIRINNRDYLRTEVQHLQTRQDRGSWIMILAEYTVAPHWSFTFSDQYNYGNENRNGRIHYPALDLAYIAGAYRFSLSGGRQRAGILCVGGVCRYVPSSSGIGLTCSTTF